MYQLFQPIGGVKASVQVDHNTELAIGLAQIIFGRQRDAIGLRLVATDSAADDARLPIDGEPFRQVQGPKPHRSLAAGGYAKQKRLSGPNAVNAGAVDARDAAAWA